MSHYGTSGVATIGSQPAPLDVRLRTGEGAEATWTRRTSSTDPTPLPWTAAPVLHLPGGVSVVATLAAADTVADAAATFTVSPAQVETVRAALTAGYGAATVTVGGRTMFAGQVTIT